MKIGDFRAYEREAGIAEHKTKART